MFWERRSQHPMLDIAVFSNARFSAASASITAAFFALFGFIFTVTQYLQFVKGYDTFETGVRTLPFAVATGLAAPFAVKMVRRVGTKYVVAAGLATMAIGFLLTATFSATTTYTTIAASMVLLGGGLGLIMAPATESIMGSLPTEKAGVGSAVNDTTRQLGGTLGVAVVGSLFASAYGTKVTLRTARSPARSSIRCRAELDRSGIRRRRRLPCCRPPTDPPCRLRRLPRRLLQGCDRHRRCRIHRIARRPRLPPRPNGHEQASRAHTSPTMVPTITGAAG